MPDDFSGTHALLRPGELYVLRLYIAGGTPRSSRAVTNLKTLCESHLRGRYELTVVDLYKDQERAQEDQILVIPTLIRQSPSPVRRILGDLSQTDRVLAALGLAGLSP